MALWDTPHSLMGTPAAAAAVNFSSSHGPEQLQGLDGYIARVLCQAVRLPGLAGHLIRSAGLLPWLSGIAVQAMQGQLQTHPGTSGPVPLSLQHPSTALACGTRGSGITVVGVKGPGGLSGCGEVSWAFSCLQQLLAGRVGMSHGREQQQVRQVYEAYSQAVMHVLASVLRCAVPADIGALGILSGSSGGCELSSWQVQQLLQLLLVLLRAAPSVRAARQVQQQLGYGLWHQLAAAVRGVTTSDDPGAARCVQFWQELSALVGDL